MIRFNFIPRLGLFKKYLDLKTKAENIFCKKSSPKSVEQKLWPSTNFSTNRTVLYVIGWKIH